MNKLRAVLLIALAATAMLASVPARADVAQEGDSYPYQGGTGDDLVFSCNSADAIGGVCPAIPVENLLSADATIVDTTGMPTGGYWEWVDAVDITAGTDLGHGNFCGSTGELIPPAGAAALVIYVDEATGPADCLLSKSSPGVGTFGVVNITWTYDDNPV